MAVLMDVPGTAYTVRGPGLNWHMEEIDRLEEMAGMAELRRLASKIRTWRVPFLVRRAPAAAGGRRPRLKWQSPRSRPCLESILPRIIQNLPGSHKNTPGGTVLVGFPA